MKGDNLFFSLCAASAVLLMTAAWLLSGGIGRISGEAVSQVAPPHEAQMNEELERAVLPEDGIVLPVRWGDFGAKMLEAGVIDKDKFESVYEERGGLSAETKQLLYGSGNDSILMTRENANELLNLFWAFGLGNKNRILDEGPMTKGAYGAGGYASTGGWTLAKGEAMDHYSAYPWATLSEEKQALVQRVADGVFRPCCNNPVSFPDCNHGMAMLGLIELMAAEGVGEDEMFRVALVVNSYWFPETYLTLASYFDEKKGIPWDKVDPKVVLGEDYSGATGYRTVLKEVKPVTVAGGGSCGV